jgi:hypothetical protein
MGKIRMGCIAGYAEDHIGPAIEPAGKGNIRQRELY